jgi:hypothetical protein
MAEGSALSRAPRDKCHRQPQPDSIVEGAAQHLASTEAARCRRSRLVTEIRRGIASRVGEAGLTGSWSTISAFEDACLGA